MAINTLTQFLDNLYTTTWQNRMEGVADNVFNATPFWFWMKDKGKLKSQRGGRFIEENLEYAANGNISWVDKGTTVALNDFEFLTIAIYNWRYLAASIVRFGTDDQKNNGKAKIVSLMNAKLDNTEQSLIGEFESRLVGSVGTMTAGTTTASAPAFDGLQCLVANDPTSNLGGNGIAVGGIDSTQAQYAWWRNQTINMNNTSFATNGINKMRTMLNNCMNNRRENRPDIILSDQWSYEQYEAAVLTFYRVTNRKMADAGFENQTFKGIPMVWTPSIAGEVAGIAGSPSPGSSTPVAGTLYFLNTGYLSLVYDPAYWFDMTEWKPIPDQVNDRAAQIMSTCVLTTNRRRVHGVMYNINTA
jgi:hypothetical protein